ncbi:MAG: hypothetical protein EHM93_11130 [Bacteroidales bacterium]|nr:MAG: hypothetical protein EHM93_11130 [Bacteroidales bacterium]
MKTKIFKVVIITVLLFSFKVNDINAQANIDLETGLVTTGYNDVRIPGDIGTLFSLKDDLTAKSKIYYRLRASYTIKSRHTLSLLYAPLEVKSEGSVPTDISFAGELFPANSVIKATYKFNSYRLTYRYDFVQKSKLNFGLGFTAKIRDARIALESNGLLGEKSNVGFVPIINFRLMWKLNDNLGLLIDGDALAAKQGRAEDVLIAATYRVNEHIGLRAGYRILEGGADNDEVYGFALFHYASLGVSYSF